MSFNTDEAKVISVCQSCDFTPLDTTGNTRIFFIIFAPKCFLLRFKEGKESSEVYFMMRIGFI